MNSHFFTSGTTTRCPTRLATLQEVFVSGPTNSNTLAERRGESPKGKQPKRILGLIDYLDAPHVGAHDRNCGVEHLLVQRFDIALLNQAGADFLKRRVAASSAASRCSLSRRAASAFCDCSVSSC